MTRKAALHAMHRACRERPRRCPHGQVGPEHSSAFTGADNACSALHHLARPERRGDSALSRYAVPAARSPAPGCLCCRSQYQLTLVNAEHPVPRGDWWEPGDVSHYICRCLSHSLDASTRIWCPRLAPPLHSPDLLFIQHQPVLHST